MSKSKGAKKVNRIAKRLNKELKRDVFGDRFEVRQIRKSYGDGLEYFLYEMIDNADPRRNHLIPAWLNVYNANWELSKEMNDFIIFSNFWSIYHNDPERYSEEKDPYLKNK